MRKQIDVNAVAAKFERHKATVYRWVIKGKIPPPTKPNARVARWDPAMIDEVARRLRSARLRRQTAQQKNSRMSRAPARTRRRGAAKTTKVKIVQTTAGAE